MNGFVSANCNLRIWHTRWRWNSRSESAAIALALEQGISQILMDERDGRAKAKALGLQPVGVLGVLLRAKREGNLGSVQAAMLKLKQEAGFFIADKLYVDVLKQAGEIS